ncbi:MAG: class I SAM-dependent methyltransferase [Alphaproteobacteria bacterium]|nr:class I SAM-dependent methyltransferase [Alphaproteobacteria bacterium]
MGAFSADWLSLRARFDTAARAQVLEDRLARFAATRLSGSGRALQVVDLGAGSGNNHRHLSPRLPVRQHWTLVDGDEDLLRTAPQTTDLSRRHADLAIDLEAAIPDAADVVTASALIDLVSREWLVRLVRRVEEIDAALLVVLTYDGRIRWSDEDAEDAWVRDLVNMHQRGEKGFGPALGPDAPRALQDLAGPGLATLSSDWKIGTADKDMRGALVDGWAAAAAEIAPDDGARISAWAERRRQIESGLVVGHADQLMLPVL